MSTRLKLFMPLLVFLPLAVLLYFALGKDPQHLPSALLQKPLPAFQLPTLEDPEQTIGPDAITGEPGLLNVWASWCYACRVEHAFLTVLSEQRGVPLFGLNYKNEESAARQWLAEFGNPYRMNIVDRDGRLGLDLGVAGAPETFVFDRRGVIHYRHIGIVDEAVWRDILLPLLTELRAST